jgi:hypothetical protein
MRQVAGIIALAIATSILAAAPASATDVVIYGDDVFERNYTELDRPPPVIVGFNYIDHAETYVVVVLPEDGGSWHKVFHIHAADGVYQERHFQPGFGSYEFELYDAEQRLITTGQRSLYHVDFSVRANPSTFEPVPVDGDRDTTKLITCLSVFPYDNYAPNPVDITLRITQDGRSIRTSRFSLSLNFCEERRWDGTNDEGVHDLNGVTVARATVRLETYRDSYGTFRARTSRILFD